MGTQGLGTAGLRGAAVAVALVGAAIAPPAAADEPVKASEPKVLSEAGEVTAVVDAFDEGDPFDLHFTLGFLQTWKRANIRRETWINQPGLSSGNFTAATMNVAKYVENTSTLNTRLDIGVYKDIALVVRLPIVLSNSRSLEGLGGSERQLDTVLRGGEGDGQPLFGLPFKAPDRSGFDYLAVGVDLNIFNQARDRTKPTWLFGGEARFSIGEPMHACNANPPPGQVKCAHPSDIDRDGRGAAGQPGSYLDEKGRSLQGDFSGERSPGVSRGTTALEGHTILSKRIKYIEPYGGFRALLEFQQDRSDFGVSGDLKGSLVNHPPLQGSMIIGMQIIPWEMREQFQRFTIDARFTGTYRSEGRDYSELFDALGSSSSRSLRMPQYAAFTCNARNPATGKCIDSVVDERSQKVYFTGITDVQAHGSFQTSIGFTWQAGEYVKFQIGTGYTRVQGHFLTMDQPCNPDFKDDVGQSGPCSKKESSPTVTTIDATGIPNPNYRVPINAVGRRFRVDDINIWDLWLNGIVMF